MTNIDEAIKNLELFISESKGLRENDLSESDTRSKLIDRLLINVLGWDEKDIQREGHVDSGFYDYKLSVPGVKIIVEAKKNFKSFELPQNHKYASIKSLLSGNKSLIDQIRGYCGDEGIPYGVITNGDQFIFLKSFNIDGEPWKNNTCLIFNSLNNVKERFIEFYDNFSKKSMISLGLFKFLLPNIAFDSKTILSSLIDKNRELIRNSLSANITTIINAAFGEIFSEEKEDDIDFIKYCFVENNETKKNKNEIERLFDDSAPQRNNVIPIVNTENLEGQIISEIDSDIINSKDSIPPKPIIIIGSKGAGKTTFINHLFKYRLEPKEIDNHYLIYIDFRVFYQDKGSFESTKISEFILGQIYQKYENLSLHTMKVLKRIYIKDIKLKDEGEWEYLKKNNNEKYQEVLSDFIRDAKSDSLKHLELLSKYLIRERRKRLIVIIDNADQFNDDIQQKLFVFSNSLTRSSLCGTVISLREGYFYKWQNSPPFDAYESNVYHITAPNYPEVLQKRIDYAISKMSDISKTTKGENKKGISISFDSEHVLYFLKSLKNSIFANDNKEIIDFLNYTTYPNIRDGLKIFKEFLISGHTKVEDYILREKFRDEKSSNTLSVIPMHEFIKSIGLQNKVYYNSDISVIFNIFSPSLYSNDHLLKLYILSDLCDFAEKEGYRERWVSIKSIIEKLIQIGYRMQSLSDSLLSLLNKGLIDTDEQHSDIEWVEFPESVNISVTNKGFYYVRTLINKFHYWDLILQDTPIFSEEEFEIIRTSFPIANDKGVRHIKDRIAVVENFISYMIISESKQPSQILATYGHKIELIKRNLDLEIARIKRNTKSS